MDTSSNATNTADVLTLADIQRAIDAFRQAEMKSICPPVMTLVYPEFMVEEMRRYWGPNVLVIGQNELYLNGI